MIVQLEEAKHELTGMRPDIQELGQALRVEFLAAKAEELEQETLAPDFWSNSTNSSKILQTIKQYKDTVEGYNALVARLEDTIALCEMSIEENDESSLEEIQAELEAIKNEAEHKRIEVLMSGEYDDSTAIVSFHPGAGGTEAQDWCQMLYRMINR
ncbi:MAG: PCRF domain-containing protein, partial [Clostridia bacterium]|nr:PCRF domain-containing protein [Clostridia bacterium]